MPKTISEDLYACTICNKSFTNILLADSCEKSHKLIYVPLTVEDLHRLIQYIYTQDQKLLTESLMKTLTQYSRVKPPKDNSD